MPMYVLNVMGLSATEAGLTTTMLSIVGLFMGPIYGRMIGKAASAKGVLAFGSILRIVIASMGVVEGMPVALTISAIGAGIALICALLLKKLPQSEMSD